MPTSRRGRSPPRAYARARGCRGAALRVSPLPRLRGFREPARDEGADRARDRAPRAGRQHQARTRRHPRDRVHRAGAAADPRRPRPAPADRIAGSRWPPGAGAAAAGAGGGRAARGLRVPAPAREPPADARRRPDPPAACRALARERLALALGAPDWAALDARARRATGAGEHALPAGDLWRYRADKATRCASTSGVSGAATPRLRRSPRRSVMPASGHAEAARLLLELRDSSLVRRLDEPGRRRLQALCRCCWRMWPAAVRSYGAAARHHHHRGDRQRSAYFALLQENGRPVHAWSSCAGTGTSLPRRSPPTPCCWMNSSTSACSPSCPTAQALRATWTRAWTAARG